MRAAEVETLGVMEKARKKKEDHASFSEAIDCQSFLLSDFHTQGFRYRDNRASMSGNKRVNLDEWLQTPASTPRSNRSGVASQITVSSTPSSSQSRTGPLHSPLVPPSRSVSVSRSMTSETAGVASRSRCPLSTLYHNPVSRRNSTQESSISSQLTSSPLIAAAGGTTTAIAPTGTTTTFTASCSPSGSSSRLLPFPSQSKTMILSPSSTRSSPGGPFPSGIQPPPSECQSCDGLKKTIAEMYLSERRYQARIAKLEFNANKAMTDAEEAGSDSNASIAELQIQLDEMRYSSEIVLQDLQAERSKVRVLEGEKKAYSDRIQDLVRERKNDKGEIQRQKKRIDELDVAYTAKEKEVEGIAAKFEQRKNEACLKHNLIIAAKLEQQKNAACLKHNLILHLDGEVKKKNSYISCLEKERDALRGELDEGMNLTLSEDLVLEPTPPSTRTTHFEDPEVVWNEDSPSCVVVERDYLLLNEDVSAPAPTEELTFNPINQSPTPPSLSVPFIAPSRSQSASGPFTVPSLGPAPSESSPIVIYGSKPSGVSAPLKGNFEVLKRLRWNHREIEDDHVEIDDHDAADEGPSTSLGMKRKKAQGSDGKQRKLVRMMQKSLGRLRDAVYSAHWREGSKLPSALKPVIVQLAIDAIICDEYGEDLFSFLPTILPFDKGRIMRHIKRLVFEKHLALLVDRQNALLEEFEDQVQEKFIQIEEEGWKETGPEILLIESQEEEGNKYLFEPPGQFEDDDTGSSTASPQRFFPMNRSLKTITWELTLLANECWRLEQENSEQDQKEVGDEERSGLVLLKS
ncbi:hypothetical protein D9757_011851 [Collybiopsis confluens]|uniref:Ubinuclein middle domain-containing protein n=1 Tax=Collybiopsis confluens TaxID=2823264 RepID=A0A8H5D3P1_9AGAR|nr:hypothetical protein D9757_011851 [Collybiopsis confluens]